MERLSKGFFVGSVVGGWALGILLIIVGLSQGRDGLSFILFGYVPLLYAAVVVLILFYKMWDAIQDGYARTTPGKAVGFLFIPFFNLYWAFQVIWGFAKDYNSLLDRHPISAPRLPEGLFLTYVILCFTTWIPVLGVILAVINLVLGIVLVVKICDAVNALPENLPQGNGFIGLG